MNNDHPLPTLRNLTKASLSVIKPLKTYNDDDDDDRDITRRSSSQLHHLVDDDQPELLMTFRLSKRYKWHKMVGRWEEVGLRARWRRKRSRDEVRSIGDETVSLLDKPRGRSGENIVPSYRMYIRTHNNNNNNTSPTLLILPQIDPARYLSDLPDNTSIADLLLPGSHESLARFGWPFSQCQHWDSTLLTQLTEGIRFFDIRLRMKNDVLMAYHGAWPQLVSFRETLSDISRFLFDHPRETLIVCVQQETSDHPAFSRTVRRDMQPYIDADQWFLQDHVPDLGTVRGKAILMSRFGGGTGSKGSGPWSVPDSRGGVDVRMGWRPNRWPDSVLEGFEWDCGQTVARTQDWYDIYGVFNIPAKFSILTDHLRSGSHLPSSTHLTLSFASAGSIPLALPPVVAQGFGWPDWGLGWRGINRLFRDWLLDDLERLGWRFVEQQVGSKEVEVRDRARGKRSRLKGIVPMDYYRDSGVVDVMLAFNVIGWTSDRG